MNHSLKFAKPLVVIGFLFISLAFISWQRAGDISSKKEQRPSTANDTTQPRKPAMSNDDSRAEDIDKAMNNLDKELQKMDLELKKMDFSKIEKEVNEAIAKIDLAKIKIETENAMKNVDWNKIKMDVDKAMKEAQENMKELNSEKFKTEMEKMKTKIDVEKIKAEVKSKMNETKKEMEKVKAELKNMHDFTNALEKDGLIDTKKGYNIKVKDAALFINGQKQPDDIYRKYKQYYKKDKFSLSSDGDNISSL